jgi:DNA-binding PucR family transcriptional regulator
MSAMAAEASTPSFLELLAAEAPAAEFDTPVAAARAAGADPESLTALERDRATALRVRALLEHRRRRETELAGLFDTAGDLAGLRDLDAVLRAIVRRARTLLGADIAYLTLGDDARGDTYMRVTDGSVSARFQRLRLPPGAGLGGLVAQTATPYVTSDYLADARFEHLAEIDAGVTEEGLVAILGVPLRLGEQVLGVLFAANRSPRPFDREEVALLVSLGAHAAVAIDSARLLAETREALAELSEANRTIRARSASVERAAAAHDRMAALVLQGGGVSELASAVAEVLGGGLLVLDADGRVLASVGAPAPPAADVTAAAVAAARAGGGTVRREVSGAVRWFAAVVAGAEDLGALVWRPEREVDEADQRILERAAMVTALLLLFRRTEAEAEARVRGQLLDDLVTTVPDDVGPLRARAARLGVDLDAAQVMVVTSGLQPADRPRVGFWAGSYAGARRGLAATRADQVVLMLPGTAPAEAASAVADELGRVLGRPVTVGAAGPAIGPHAVPGAYAEAQQVVAALVALGCSGQSAAAGDLGFVGLLLGGGERAAHRFVRDTIGAVLDYDARRQTALRHTLEVYFRCGGSPARAAEVLHVHVNTVAQRLERVSRLLGAGWQQPEKALEIQLALRLRRLPTTPSP